MNKIEGMLQELCPEGVEYKKLGEIMYISDYVSAGSFASLRENVKYLSSPDYAILLRFTDFSSNFDPSKFIYVNKHAYDFLEKSNLHPGDIVMSNVGSCGALFSCPDLGMPMTLAPNSILIRTSNNRFYYHWLMSDMAQKQIAKIKSKSAMPKFNKTDFKNILVPVPPLPVQEEIVRILDHFTELTASLQAELQTRQEQYEYYRNKLLTFTKIGGGTQSVTWMKMSELFDIRNGYTPSKAKSEYWENGAIPWFRMEDIRQNGRILSDAIQHITPQAVKGGRFFHANSFIIATTATIGEHALIIVDSLANQQFTNLEIRKSLSDKIIIKFLYYYMFIVGEWCKNNTNVSGFASVDMSKFKKLLIPIPPISEQKRIVSILDKFEALVNDLSQGLPAEIAAVQEQYEYYRNKLLTFNRLN